MVSNGSSNHFLQANSRFTSFQIQFIVKSNCSYCLSKEMWNTLDSISEQVTKYSSFLGKLWYIFVFLFRLMVVATVGNSVYGDEQSAFKCSEDVVGCTNMCYNEFAKISHMRFWAFQLIAVVTPTVFFHFYSIYVSGEIEKLKSSEKDLKQIEEADGGRLTLANSMSEGDVLKMSRRMKSVGAIKVRKIYSDNALKEVPYTNNIKRAYNLSIVFRIVIEGIFIYFAYIIFNHLETKCELLQNKNSEDCTQVLGFLWLTVPGSYHCLGTEPGARRACGQHFAENGKGFVPCYVSRPYEKTIFLRYMMTLSAICFVISILELFVVVGKKIWKRSSIKRRNIRRRLSHQDSVFYASPSPSAPSKMYEGNSFYPALGVPVRMGNSKRNSKEFENKTPL